MDVGRSLSKMTREIRYVILRSKLAYIFPNDGCREVKVSKYADPYQPEAAEKSAKAKEYIYWKTRAYIVQARKDRCYCRNSRRWSKSGKMSACVPCLKD